MSFKLTGKKHFSKEEPEPEKQVFTTKSNRKWPKAFDWCEALYCFMTCKPVATGAKISEGPLCGVEVFYIPKTGECVYFDTETKDFTPFEGAVENCVNKGAIPGEPNESPPQIHITTVCY